MTLCLSRAPSSKATQHKPTQGWTRVVVQAAFHPNGLCVLGLVHCDAAAAAAHGALSCQGQVSLQFAEVRWLPMLQEQCVARTSNFTAPHILSSFKTLEPQIIDSVMMVHACRSKDAQWMELQAMQSA